MNTRHPFSNRLLAGVLWAAVLAGLYLTRQYSFLLFHSLAELFSISIACGVFMVAWNTRRSLEDPYLVYVATGYLFAAALDGIHLLSYKGMGVFPGSGANVPTQLWIAARYLQSLSLLAAPWLADRRVNTGRAVAGCGVTAALLAASVFAGVFPDCFVEGRGLTPFKIYSEYAIAVIFACSIVLAIARRSGLDRDVRSRLVASIGAAVLAEISFTLYERDVYGFFNFLGHFLKILSFYLLYRAVIATEIVRRLERLVRDLRRSEEEARAALRERRESEDRLRRIFELSPIGIAIADMDARFVDLNPAYEKMMGYTAAELKGKPVSCVSHPDNVPQSRELFQELVGGKRSYYDLEKRYVRKDGSVIWVRLRASVLRGGDGKPEHAFSMVEDITASKRTREDLRASEARFRALVERLPVGICIVQAGRILFQNPRMEALFGRVEEGLELRRWMDVHPEDAVRFEGLCRALDGGDFHPTETDLRFYPSGKSAEGIGVRWVQFRATPIEHLGKPAALLSLIDVTRAKELEHLVRVREKMSALGHVAAGIAHEIRNPLSGINMHVSNLERLFGQADGLEPAEREKITDIVGMIRSASGKIGSVIRKVMEFSKPAPPRMDRVHLNVAVEEAVRLSMVEMRKRGVQLEMGLAPDLPPCPADLRMIEQVVLNLINNAAQAMEGIEGPRRIEIASFRDRDRVVVRVSDSGPGVPPDLRSKIFDPFFTTRKDGYGIGLSFSHRMVADHGGLLSVGTSRWGGAEFRVEIPCAGEATVA